MFVEVESNQNCDSSVFLRFKAVGPARRITHVRIYDRLAHGEWCEIVGWCDDPVQPRCPAMAQPIEDSGAGTAYLVFGGNWGLRLKPESLAEEWNLESPNQWGEPYLSLSDERDIRYDPQSSS